MKAKNQKVIILAAGIAFAVMLVPGCEERNLESNKKTKLIAAENIQLKKQLQQRDETIKMQEELLEQCREETDLWKDTFQEGAQGLGTVSAEHFLIQNAKLRQENQKLKANVEQLEKDLQELSK
jgi:cell division protein FtsB